MTIPDIIGITGYAGSGKDTLARLLAKQYGYRVTHFADPLREMLRRLDPIIWASPTGLTNRWRDAEEALGYAGAKAAPDFGPEFRAVMQRLGTEAGREVLGEDVWVDALFRTITAGERVVVADMRFPNEFRAIRRRGGMLVRVVRPGVGPANGHVSETALDGYECDLTIGNRGLPEDMVGRFARHLTAVTA